MNEIVLTSSVLILILAALRRILRGRIAPTLQYALWLLVAARLLIPGTLFTAPVSVLGFAEDIHSAVVERLPEEAPDASDTAPPLYIPEHTIIIDPIPAPDAAGDTNRIPAPQITPTPAKPAIDWRDIIWKAGMSSVGGVFLLSNLIFYCKLRRSRQRIPDEELPSSCPVPVYFVDDLDAPCLFGLRSSIYVNRNALDSQRLHHVIIHELTHRRHGDHFWALLRCVCLAVHWYNPLVWWAAILSRRDCETSCDSAVLHKLGSTCAISYGETLMAMLTTSPTGILRTATTMSVGKRT
ncbi:MAG: peptidase M56, partial [Oscillospiraceae bacterium]|nr:peptidase M56 [Oscillospiraceae bacterium]